MKTTPAAAKHSETRRILEVFWKRKLSVFGLAIIFLAMITAAFAPVLAPYDPNLIDISNNLQPPSKLHLLGTDAVGRDILSRIIFGARTSFVIGICAVSAGTVIGMMLGMTAAYFGGAVYAITMRFIDALMCLPGMLVALIIAAMLGAGIRNVIIALAIAVIPNQARLMCSQAITIKENDYVMAARISGANNLRIMLKYILPNAFAPLLVLITIDLGVTILAEASLSFLGVGVVAPAAAWGSMVNEGYVYLLSNPWISIAPGFTLMLLVFGFNMTGDGLRDALDPRLRGAV